jgi:hypothetical protein
MAVVVASTVLRFMVFIRAYATEELDDYTTMQPLMVANLFFFSGLASRWLLVVSVDYTGLRGMQSVRGTY